jgi:predicted DNA-binding antitoxin AbrB/MazE fold protein
MFQVVAATFEDGVFKPDQRPDLSDSTRVRLTIESAGKANDEALRKDAWARLENLWANSTFNSGGDRLNRDELHERR